MTEAANTAPDSLFRDCCGLLERGDPAAATLLPRLEQYPAFAPGWEQLGATLLAAGKAQAATVAWLRAAAGYATAEQRDPDNRALPFARAQCLRRAGRLAKARAGFERAVALHPLFAEAWFGLGLVQQDLHDLPAAVAAFAAALAARSGWHEAALNLGIVRQETGDMDGALDAYGVAYRSRPETLARIAQALVSSSTGRLWLDPARLRGVLASRAGAGSAE